MGKAILVTAAAGVIGTGLGGAAACVFRRDSGREASLFLSFAAGVMVSVVCFGQARCCRWQSASWPAVL